MGCTTHSPTELYPSAETESYMTNAEDGAARAVRSHTCPHSSHRGLAGGSYLLSSGEAAEWVFITLVAPWEQNFFLDVNTNVGLYSHNF